MSTATQAQSYMRLQDRVSGPSAPSQLGVGLLLRTWEQTDPQPEGLHRIRIQGKPEALTVECFGTGVLVPSSSTAVRANTIFAANPASREGMAFFAEFDFGHMVSRFQGNVNLGLLVLAGFHDFKDGSARSNYFSREFFYSLKSPKTELFVPDVPSPAKGSRCLDTSALSGIWHNTNGNSQGVATVKIRDLGEHLGIRAYGVGESGALDWGEIPGRAYAMDASSPDAMAFSAVFAAEEICCHLQANIKQGVLVIAYFTEFNDGSGRSNYFTREFYHKER